MTAPLTIHLFGPMRVQVHGKPMPRVRARSAEWLLALLVLRHGRTVQRSWLAGTLWPDSEETQALQNLRHALLSLRKALQPEERCLQSPTRDTLTLDLSDIETDVLRFDVALHKGGEEALRSAVEVYTGPLLEGCDEEWVFPERAARDQACLQALETLAAGAEQREDYADALSLLRRAQGMDALRDTSRRGLMRVLAASGNAPAALLCYRDYRVLLREEMNVEPDEETVRLYQQIREQARQTAQHREVTLRESPLVLASSPVKVSLPTGLPHTVSALIGREQEIQEIDLALSRSRLVTLVGGGGVGKTRLAIEIAGLRAADFADGVAFVELASLSDPALLPTFVASALGIREETRSAPEALLQALTGWLTTHPVLLVLDNCEHLVAAAASLVQALMDRCPGLHILATSRQRLGLTGEVAWRVPSLPVPDLQQLPADPAEASAAALTFPAIQLFVERAASAHSEFQLTRREELEAVAHICQRLDGIPLAIELAAARVRSLTVEDINDKLDQRFRLLTGGSRTALPRQQTLRALIDWSYALLSEVEQVLLCRLSIFSGGWTLEAAERVCADELVEEWEMLDLLTNLTDKSLVAAVTSGMRVRYRLLETVRQYAQEKLTVRGEEEVVRRRHQQFFLALAEEAEPKLTGPEQALWLQKLENEHDNLRAAMEFEEKVAGLRIAGALWRFWWMRGYLSEGRMRLTEALRLPGEEAENAPARARALYGIGALAANQGDLASARPLLEQSLTIRRELEDKGGIAASLGHLGVVAFKQGDYASARTLYEESLEIQRELGDKWGIAASLSNLGNVSDFQGDYASARTLHEETLAIRRELGDQRSIAASLDNLGIIALKQADYVSARPLLEQSLAMRRELGDRWGIAACLSNLGLVANFQGDYASSRTLQEESLTIRRELEDRWCLVGSLEAFAALAVSERQLERAARMWGGAQRLREEIGMPVPPGEQEEYDCLVADARAALAEDVRFDGAWQEGRAMSLEQAIEHALERLAPQAAQRKESILPEAHSASASSPVGPCLPVTLPHPLTTLIGREQETHDVVEALSRSRLVTLVGGGGVGKTRLAIQVARKLASDFARKVAFVELASLSDPALLPTFVASALGIREETRSAPEALLQALTGWLTAHPVLLVLDNCEHLIEAAASLTQIVLERCPELRILTTSRQRLALTGEITWRVPSLPSPDPEDFRLSQANAPIENPSTTNPQRAIETRNSKLENLLLEYPAVQLFVERAAMARPGFHLADSEEGMAVAQICHRLDGIPLAIELAAARVGVLSVVQIAARLGDRFRLLTGGSRMALPRQQTLYALISWSYDLLPEEEQALLCRLSVFAGGWTLQAAEAVAGRVGETFPTPFPGPFDTLDRLASLLDKSLVVSEEKGGDTRYRMLETVREYAAEKLRECGAENVTRDRHLAYYLEQAQASALTLWGADPEPALGCLETEVDNFRTALVWAQAHASKSESCLQIAAALWPFWELRGYLTEGRTHLRIALSLTASSDSPIRAQALRGATVLALSQSDVDEALTFGQECLERFRVQKDMRGMASALLGLGEAHLIRQDKVLAVPLLREALDYSRQSEWRTGTILVTLLLGKVHIERHEREQGQAFMEEALALAEALGDPRMLARAYRDLGVLETREGHSERARTLLEKSLEIRIRLGDRMGIAYTLGCLGDLEKYEDMARAIAYCREEMAIYRELGNVAEMTHALHRMGNLHYLQGDYEPARRAYVEALEMSLSLHSEVGFAYVRMNLGSTLFHLGDPHGALERHREALALYRKAQNEEGIVWAMERIGVVEARYGEAREAARLMGTASVMRQALGIPLPPLEKRDWEEALETLRAQGHEIAFAEEGEALNPSSPPER